MMAATAGASSRNMRHWQMLMISGVSACSNSVTSAFRTCTTPHSQGTTQGSSNGNVGATLCYTSWPEEKACSTPRLSDAAAEATFACTVSSPVEGGALVPVNGCRPRKRQSLDHNVR